MSVCTYVGSQIQIHLRTYLVYMYLGTYNGVIS